LAGFEVTLIGRFWVTPEGLTLHQLLVHRLDHPPNTFRQLLHVLVGRGIGLGVSQVS
jgi:hypothetical protein